MSYIFFFSFIAIKFTAIWCNIQGNDTASSKGEDKNITESLNDRSTENTISNLSTDQALNKKLGDMETLLNQNEHLRNELNRLKKQLEQAGKEKDNEREKINDLEIKARNDETERRKLHNEIMGLKGNIRVFCRVRPLIRDKNVQHDIGNHILFSDKKIELVKKGEKNEKFIFNKVFRHFATQHDVFEEISQLVQSALDGYNVCIFAYGQTGSGKTYTMEGSSDHGSDDRGIIPRAVEQIFEKTRNLKGIQWTYNFYASFLEIYNEKIRDLLCDDRKANNQNQNEVSINKIPSVEVKTEEEVHRLLRKAFKNRTVEPTNCNKKSSRSHSVFTLKFKGKNSKTNQRCDGILNLIDLAGNESLKKSLAEGQRKKETAAINTSLSQLGIVIRAIKTNQTHIPFKDSTLTTLLQNSLERDSKTLMFVNISLAEECSQETLNSLRFARDVSKCNLKNQQPK